MRTPAFALSALLLTILTTQTWCETLTESFVLNNGVFTTLTVPGAIPGTTRANGVNNAGEIVGSFYDGTGEHGFLDNNGVFTTIDVPGFVGTAAVGINNSGQIVGGVAVEGGFAGFLYSNGVFTGINFPGSFATAASGINVSGQIVGDVFLGSLGNENASVDTNGTFSVIPLPFSNVFHSEGASTNDLGEIVGVYFNPLGAHGFLDAGGAISSIDDPTANGTYAYGINNSGQIVGFVQVGPQNTIHAFVDTSGQFTLFDVPDGINTVAKGINDHGEIVGTFDVGSIPEPTSLAMVAAGLFLLPLAMRQRNRKSSPI